MSTVCMMCACEQISVCICVYSCMCLCVRVCVLGGGWVVWCVCMRACESVSVTLVQCLSYLLLCNKNETPETPLKPVMGKDKKHESFFT